MDSYYDNLKKKMDEYVHLVYKISRDFPKEEVFNTTSQLRRSSLSVILNFIEGYARMREKENRHFLEISYGSLKESIYLLEFSKDEKFINPNNQKDFDKSLVLGNEIGAMLWGIIKKLR